MAATGNSTHLKDHSKRPVVLIHISGKDQPGITADLTKILMESGAQILDMGQAVIHGLLSLSILFEVLGGDPQAPLKDLLFRANALGLRLDFKIFPYEEASRDHFEKTPSRYALTLIGDRLSAKTVHEATQILARYQMNIDRIQKLSEEEFQCIELLVSSVKALESESMKRDLLQIAQKERVDIALQSEGLFRRSKRLIAMDMDSTLIQNEVIDELARENGVFEEVSKITLAAMRGEIAFDESLTRRCTLLKGLRKKNLEAVYDRLQMTTGAQLLVDTCKKLGYRFALLSGGFSFFADRMKDRLGLDYAFANQLEWKDETLTGKVLPPVLNAQRKADLLEVICHQENIPLDQTIAIGDGANDILMLEKAGLGIAFNAKPSVSEKADFSLTQKSLRTVLYLLGISGNELKSILE